MGWRIRKTVPLLPGIRLNLSKTGASLSVGERGATVNLGRKGVRSTFGLPGTGISYTTQHTTGRPESGAGSGGARTWWIVLLVAVCLGLALARLF